MEATVTRQMLIPVGSSTQKYVGGGIGYVEDPRGYGYEERTIHTYRPADHPVAAAGRRGGRQRRRGRVAELSDRGVLARRVLADRAAAGALDAMRWSDLARLYTPVTATPQPRTRAVPLAETDPDSGARWGRPSAFS